MKVKATEQELQTMVQKGEQAKQLWANPLFKEIVKKLEDRLITSWRQAIEVSERERLHARLTALTAIVDNIRSYGETGVFAERELAQRAKVTTSKKKGS